MTKRKLLDKLKDLNDDDELFFVSREYDPRDDCTWMAETQTDIKRVIKHEGDVFVVLDCDTFE